jgi:hypothetical protein
MPDQEPAQQPSAQQPVALLGTGIMGAGMGRSMLRAGLPVRTWNRTLATARALESAGATIAVTPAEAVRDASVIVTMLSDGDAVLATMTAAIPGLRADHTEPQSTVQDGVRAAMRLITSPDLDNVTGRYFDVQQEAAALAQAYDADARQRLREVSEQLTALVSSH